MSFHILIPVVFLAFVTTVSAATSALPVQILCTPDEYHRAGIEQLDLPGDQAHLFEYGGKVTINKSGGETNYSYGEGQAFYKLKEKTLYSNDFVDIQQDLYLYSDPGWGDSRGFLILRGEMGTGYFHIDWAKQRYYGYLQEFGAINSYAGSCTVLKK